MAQVQQEPTSDAADRLSELSLLGWPLTGVQFGSAAAYKHKLDLFTSAEKQISKQAQVVLVGQLQAVTQHAIRSFVCASNLISSHLPSTVESYRMR